jgi:cation diffusion facilitator CzcD-associated flavoprotein CzcO
MRLAVIGGGMAGILAGIRLKEAGFCDFTIYEKADRLGGTWRENTYPGIACDVPSHVYAYSFALNPDWSRRFSPGDEIQAYFCGTAERFNLMPHVRFGEEVTSCEWTGGRWQLATATGQRDTVDAVIAATGVLHHPNIPVFPGQETFGGAMFHSARWDHTVGVDGRRLGVVGTGSTAVQIVSALADRVDALTLFQRTPQWILVEPNFEIPPEKRAAYREDPARLQQLFVKLETGFRSAITPGLIDPDSDLMHQIEERCRLNLEEHVQDPVLREKLRPDYRVGCKRLVMSADFYEAIQKPNARVVTDGIERFEPAGVRTADGTRHELDVVVLATGFKPDRFVRPIRMIGRHGVDLDDVWADGPVAYLSIGVANFPNFFMLNGPNGPVGNFSLVQVVERQFDYILALLEELAAGRCTEISPSEQAMKDYEAERTEAARQTVWASGCKSWYLDKRGVPATWPFDFERFLTEMQAPNLDHFERSGTADG